ncbi:MAG TPA: sigma-70 family RNA polymerase sigma factor [Streptosporangiaceae bacterium]|jgi:RNA polymerase sigma factor (sigma-70 family)
MMAALVAGERNRKVLARWARRTLRKKITGTTAPNAPSSLSAVPSSSSAAGRSGGGFVQHRTLADEPPAVSAETVALGGEERQEVIRALARLPHRQREVLVLRFYAELPDEQIARVMGIRPGTVRSTAFRALDALGRVLKETS